MAERLRSAIAWCARLAYRLVKLNYRSDEDKFSEHLRAIVIAGFIGVLLTTIFLFTVADVGSVYALKDYRPPTPSKLLDRKGRLVTTFFQDQRILVPKEELPEHLFQAFIAMEDNNFYKHHGVSPQGILRAFLINLTAGGVRQGGSTITQQLAKVILTNQERSLMRKAKEALLALFLDAIFEKKDILHLYFNQIYFGHGAYGVESASRFYFEKTVKDITIGEAAILSALPAAPNYYSPVRNPRQSLQRMTMSLLKMVDMGFIDKKTATIEYGKILKYFNSLNIPPSATVYGQRLDEAPYYSEMVRAKLEREIGRDLLYNGGLEIQGTIDLDHQDAAQRTLWPALKQQNKVSRQYTFTKYLSLSKAHAALLDILGLSFDLPEISGIRKYSAYAIGLHYFDELADTMELVNLGMGGEPILDIFQNEVRQENPYLNRYLSVEGAFIELDNKTGEITAMIGGTPFSTQNQINRAIQMKRQPGSTFKPLVYASAIELKKVTAASVFADTPVIFLNEEGSAWMPENYSGGYAGFISLRDALTTSANMVSIAVAREAGLGNLLPVLEKILDVREKDIPYNLSVALGTYEVSPLQMATAFSLFPRGGARLTPVILREIRNPDGTVLKKYPTSLKGEQIISPETATIVSSMLENVVNSGTATAIRSYGYKAFAAGKTGTTNNFRDAWFVGFNDRYTSAIWMGYDRPTLSLGAGQAGGAIAAPIWAQYQIRVFAKRKNEESHLIQGKVKEVPICVSTGMLPGPGCRQVRNELFIPGTEPEEASQETTGTIENLPLLPKTESLPAEDFFQGDENL